MKIVDNKIYDSLYNIVWLDPYKSRWGLAIRDRHGIVGVEWMDDDKMDYKEV